VHVTETHAKVLAERFSAMLSQTRERTFGRICPALRLSCIAGGQEAAKNDLRSPVQQVFTDGNAVLPY